MIRKLYYTKKLLILAYLFYVQISVNATDNITVRLPYNRYDGNSAFLVDTPEGICIFTKKHKKNLNLFEPNDKNAAFLTDMSGTVYKEIWNNDIVYPNIAAAYDQNQVYLLVISKNQDMRILTIFNAEGVVLKNLQTKYKIYSAIPIKVDHNIGFILLTHASSEKAFIWFLNDKFDFCLRQNNLILSCAGIDTPQGYKILTGSQNTNFDGFMKIWNYEKNLNQLNQNQPYSQINYITWWDTLCSNLCKMLPSNILNLLPDSITVSQDCKDRFVDIAAIQSKNGDVCFIAASENGAKIGNINNDSVVWNSDIRILTKGLVSCVAAVNTPYQDLFLAVLKNKIYIYTINGIYVTELDFIIKKNYHPDGFSALYKDNKIYIVAKNENNFCTWILDAQNYNIIEGHDFSIDDITYL